MEEGVDLNFEFDYWRYAVKSFVAATAALRGVVDVLVTANQYIIFNQMQSFRTYGLFRSRIRRGCFNVDGKG
jgi:hypothetical protein